MDCSIAFSMALNPIDSLSEGRTISDFGIFILPSGPLYFSILPSSPSPFDSEKLLATISSFDAIGEFRFLYSASFVILSAIPRFP